MARRVVAGRVAGAGGVRLPRPQARATSSPVGRSQSSAVVGTAAVGRPMKHRLQVRTSSLVDRSKGSAAAGTAVAARTTQRRPRAQNAVPGAQQNSPAPNVGQTGVNEWAEVSGVVVSADETALMVQTDDGATVEIINRPWSFAVSQGFMAEAGDQVTVTGFYEGDTFEAAQISDATSGESREHPR